MGLGIASVLIGMGGGREIKFLAGRVKGGARTGVLRTIFGVCPDSPLSPLAFSCPLLSSAI
eukprot:1322181-Amorphochlora_amoeboformis.AAC.3